MQNDNLGGGQQIPVEIYMMQTLDGATDVFARKGEPGDPLIAIGDFGVRGEYIIFRRGRFLVPVAAADLNADAKAAVLRMARAVETRIPATCP